MEVSMDLVGLRVKVKTVTGEEFDGAVYAVDPDQSIFVLYEPSDLRNRSNFRIFKTEALTDITPYEDGQRMDLPYPLSQGVDLPRLNPKVIRENADANAKERALKLGHDVTIEAQDIFDALSKTYPCSWDQQTIVVLGETRIDPPYVAESVHAEPGKSVPEPTLERVRKVLAGERKRLNLPSAPA
eukprot:TRINITY_DN2464_c0_g1_i2.p2 TRINITY_DN2464_c0_g1~~TRINITY_DN2464_c0_g1_i2.p2  ORF type:complete len:185 (-),score=48.05 TRINITY_DN2464_c0_g1_i2:354-908(-)